MFCGVWSESAMFAKVPNISLNLLLFFHPQSLDFNKTSVIKTGWGKNEKLVEEIVEDPEPAPPTFTKKDLIPDPSVFKVFDQHAMQVK